MKLSSTLTIEKSDNKEKTHEHVTKLLTYAKEQKLEGNVIRFLDNAVQQMQKVLDAAKVIEEKKATEVPKEFTPAKYKVKPMPKLNAKKITVKKTTAMELQKKLQEGQGAALNIDKPVLVSNASALFELGVWDHVKRHWTASRIMNDEYLEKELKIEYWPPDKARARLVGNMLHMQEPEHVPFSRYMVVCFHGTPAKPKLPGQNTEHCEQTVAARSMVHNSSELEELNVFKELKNALPLQAEYRRRLLEASGSEINAIMGKGAEKFKRSAGQMSYQFFVFGPSGSGDKLHAENGLPFYDVLIHGSKRWLLLQEDEMNRVAEKAREALEFDKTSAYMFFEEKLPELREEFGLKKFVEANQQAGDMIIVPSGWFRVSLALADSISYYQTLLTDPQIFDAVVGNQVWRPNFRQFQLAFCYDPQDIQKLPQMSKGSQMTSWLENAMIKAKSEEVISGIMNTLFQCGSVLAMKTDMPHITTGSSVCTEKVWKQCRKKLKAEMTRLGKKSVTLDWLPEKAPKSIDAIRPTSKAEATKSAPSEEL